MNFLKKLRSWKTTSAGLTAIIVAIGHIAKNNWELDALSVTAIITGLGQMVSKDYNVTGTSAPPSGDEAKK